MSHFLKRHTPGVSNGSQVMRQTEGGEVSGRLGNHFRAGSSRKSDLRYFFFRRVFLRRYSHAVFKRQCAAEPR